MVLHHLWLLVGEEKLWVVYYALEKNRGLRQNEAACYPKVYHLVSFSESTEEEKRIITFNPF